MAYGQIREGTPEQWSRESRYLAQSVAYRDIPDEGTATLSKAYQEVALETAQRQITRAGYRLARLLNRLLGA